MGGITGGSALAYASLKGQADQLQARLATHLEIGQSELEAAKGSLKQANANHDVNLIAPAKAHFAAARVQFTAAGQVADSSQLLRRLEGLPAVGDLAHSRHVAGCPVRDAALTGISPINNIASPSNKSVKPLPSRAQGTAT